MFTRLRLPVFQTTGNWLKDGPLLVKWQSDYWLSLEQKNALSLDEAAITVRQGIQFPAAQVPSTDANNLDDYEEGTWVPTDGSGATLSFTVDHATYTKVGRLVSGQAKITYPVTASGAGSQINGLPFASAKQTAGPCGSDGGSPTWILISGSSINPEPLNGGGILNSALSGKTLWINFSYYT